MKTQFSPGVIVTSKWLNGAQQIFFDSKDEDWHYDPLDLSSIQKDGNNGFDSRYVTLTTQQTITGGKLILGKWEFGEDGCPVTTLPSNAPRFPVTNCKWLGGTTVGDIDRLNDDDVITKLIFNNILGALSLDDIDDVDCISPLDGFVLTYSATASAWVCGDELDGGNF